MVVLYFGFSNRYKTTPGSGFCLYAFVAVKMGRTLPFTFGYDCTYDVPELHRRLGDLRL